MSQSDLHSPAAHPSDNGIGMNNHAYYGIRRMPSAGNANRIEKIWYSHNRSAMEFANKNLLIKQFADSLYSHNRNRTAITVFCSKRHSLNNCCGFNKKLKISRNKMEFNKRSRTTNREQFALMVERMKLNGGIAKNMSNEPPEVVSVFWTSLSTDLNALGPPTKSLAEWKKVWSDFKSSIKKKYSYNRIQMRATGGGPNREVKLTALEEEVAQLVNIPDAVAGVSGRHCGTPQGPSRGSHTDSAASEPSTSGAVNREEADMENAENLNVNSSSPTSPQPQQRVPQRRTQLTLLKTQLDMQKKYYDNVVCNLKSQKRKMEDVANNLKKVQKTMSSLNNNVEGMRSILGDLVAETKRHNLVTEQLLRHKTKVKEQLLELELQGVKNALKK